MMMMMMTSPDLVVLLPGGVGLSRLLPLLRVHLLLALDRPLHLLVDRVLAGLLQLGAVQGCGGGGRRRVGSDVERFGRRAPAARGRPSAGCRATTYRLRLCRLIELKEVNRWWRRSGDWHGSWGRCGRGDRRA